MSKTLSIAVVTMNRAEKLKDALNSCLSCELPKETEFVIIDNASTDNTEQVVKDVLDACGFNYYYEKKQENLGVGKGRNYAFEKSTGLYFYSLDDDAVISADNKDFFKDAIKVFEENQNIVTLTTQIYDEAWQKNRVESHGRKLTDKLSTCYSFCGGSHFLRKNFFKTSPYLANKYGYEELLPSFKAYNEGKLNVFCENLLVIHKPIVNKWDYSIKDNQSLLVKGFAQPYAIKKMMYPIVFFPIVYFGYKSRCKKYLLMDKDTKKLAKQIIKETVKNSRINYKLKLKTIVKMYKEFGITVF